MIYIDSSVALARLLFEARSPPATFWQVSSLVSSRLFKYELWNRIHAYQLMATHARTATELVDLVQLIDLTDPVLERALRPWPVPIRTPDGLHLATIDFLRRQGEPIELATYDKRMLDAARAMGVPIASL